MCGVIGIISKDFDRRKVYEALRALRSRGQEATGIMWVSNGFTNEDKCLGTADKLPDYFKEAGTIDLCLGSTRYPTIGDNSKKFNIKEYVAPFNVGGLRLCHNGQIIHPKLSGEDNDGAMLTRLLKEEIDDKVGIEKAVSNLMKRIDGSYSAVATLEDELIAFRDPHGIRPLCWGELGEGYAVASETNVLRILGIKEFNIVPAGTLMVFKPDYYEKHRLAYEKPAHCMFEWTYFSRVTSHNEGREVYTIRQGLGRKLGELLKEKNIQADCVIPVPNTARPAAKTCADYLGIPYDEGLIKTSDLRTFIMSSDEDRVTAVANAFDTVESVVKDKELIVVDDSIVRGSTFRGVIKRLRKDGAIKIHTAITTPPIKYPCGYGIDMSRQQDLMAQNKKEEQIEKELGLDSLTYMTIQGLKESIGLEDICTACLDGKYPTPKGMEMSNNRNNGGRAYE